MKWPPNFPLKIGFQESDYKKYQIKWKRNIIYWDGKV